tara:strand:+ start:2017 stop:2202 length:186 start_codon:yes stop_codon:yes gene_type:complete
MDTHREFALQRFRQDIAKCSDVKELQEMSIKLMQLYLRQQDTVNKMVSEGFLPDAFNNQRS